jgi:lipopolysaccharide biosynthesis regulator YciM
LPPLLECHRASGGLEEFDAYLGQLLAKDTSLHRDFAYAAIIGNLEGSAVLRSAVERFVFAHPVLAALVNAKELEALAPAQRVPAIERITEALRKVALANARYRCGNCGYSTQRFIWHCPSCKLWETVRPIQSVPLETVITRA